MTIKELENKTGMTRANIRFYESEGLLSPRRLDNGYRDYSEEDARTLEKIRLLRQLQLDLDTIRKVQQGALTLDQALFTQLTRLEGDRLVIERAAAVCRELEQSGVEYAALDPQPWLAQLERPPVRPVLPNPPPPTPKEEAVRDDTPRACYHPWQRWLARLLDITLYSTVFGVLWLVLLRDQTIVTGGAFVTWMRSLLGLAFALAVEPLWLHSWGWTPGKWVFGLKLRDRDGGKLTLAQGWRRSGGVIREGYGLNIPVYNLWRAWKCREMGLEGRDCHWDGEEGHRYTKEERRFSSWIFAGVQVVCVILLLVGVLYTNTPPCRGGLTVEQFARNYNYYHKQLGEGSSGLPTLSNDGRWVEEEQPSGTVVIHMFGDTTVWSDPVFTLDGDRVVKVELHMESRDKAVGGDTRELLTLLAMSGSLDGLNLFTYDLRGWVKTYQEQFSEWKNTKLTYRGLRITQEAEYEGYEPTNAFGAWLWCEDEDVPHHCEKTVTIALVEP